MKVSERIFDAFSSWPASTSDLASKILSDVEHELHTELGGLLAGIPTSEMALMLDSKMFSALYGGNVDKAKLTVFSERIQSEIEHRRLQVLREETSPKLSLPYSLREFDKIHVDDEGLCKLSQFAFDSCSLRNAEVAFRIFPVANAPQSSYWLLEKLYDQKIREFVSVRIDPFLHGNPNLFPRVQYKMVVHGRSLDWQRIENLKEPDFGRWMNEERNSVITDFCWEPRGEEVHFVCEEIPESAKRAGRYLHAIYLKETGAFIHLDGALRVYDETELDTRRSTHVRTAGKVGVRKKIFRLDAPLPRDAFSEIAKTFFIWNDDAESYF